MENSIGSSEDFSSHYIDSNEDEKEEGSDSENESQKNDVDNGFRQTEATKQYEFPQRSDRGANNNGDKFVSPDD